jgi:hypothetical protein
MPVSCPIIALKNAYMHCSNARVCSVGSKNMQIFKYVIFCSANNYITLQFSSSSFLDDISVLSSFFSSSTVSYCTQEDILSKRTCSVPHLPVLQILQQFCGNGKSSTCSAVFTVKAVKKGLA